MTELEHSRHKRQGDLEIYCANCGKRYTANVYTGWIERESHTRVCGKECHDQLQKSYFHTLIAVDPPQQLEKKQ